MSCPNCTKFHKTCKAICCEPVPIGKEVFRQNFYLIQRPIRDSVDLQDEMLPMTDDMTCVFLSSDLKCMIYDKRPDVCKKFGDETHPMMTCAYQTKAGEARSTKETERMIKEHLKYADKRINK